MADGQARLERRTGHRDPDPGEPGLADRGDDPVAARRLAAEGGPCPVPAELAEELRPGQRSLVAGHLGPEGLHERRRPGSRDAEERLEVAAREQIAVQGLELLDGVGDGEQPAGRGGHPGAPCRLHPLRRVRGGTMDGAHAVL